MVYVGSYDGKLYAFAVGCASGGGACSPLWTGATGAVIISSPAVANGVVYVGSYDHKLYAFDLNSPDIAATVHPGLDSGGPDTPPPPAARAAHPRTSPI